VGYTSYTLCYRVELTRFGALSFALIQRRDPHAKNTPTVPPPVSPTDRELTQAGLTPRQLTGEFEPSEQTIRSWIKRAKMDEGSHSNGSSSPEREELRHLRKELRRLQQERDILAKAATWFAQEMNVIPKRSSRS